MQLWGRWCQCSNVGQSPDWVPREETGWLEEQRPRRSLSTLISPSGAAQAQMAAHQEAFPGSIAGGAMVSAEVEDVLLVAGQQCAREGPAPAGHVP